MARLPVAWRVATVPSALSLALSLSTVGSTAFWQDSGGYLLAVHDLGILYPHGFVLYLLLCKAWTTVFFFLDFTLAVHLFSSACAAAAAGVIALAARAWLRSRGEVFRLFPEPSEPADWAAAGAGCLAACGYTFWFSGIYAKGYSLLYLALALILRQMIRADESRRPRDLTILAALFGLAWACHPSAALLGPAFVLFVVSQRRTVGLAGIAGRTGLAAACAIGPVLLLPLLAARDPWFMMGDPRDLAGLLEYVLGRRFTQKAGTFGSDASRWASLPLYFWEEFLAVGILLVAAGLVRLARTRPPLLGGLLVWAVPFSLVTLLFKIEGQHDCWLVAVWIPLHLVAALGLDRLAVVAGPRARWAVAGTVLVGAGWGIAVNRPLLDQRGYTLADEFARAHLDSLDPGAILLMEGDDAIFLCGYAQRVAGRRPDVVLLSTHLLGEPWYERKIAARHPFLRPPDYARLHGRFPDLGRDPVAKGAFIRANAAAGRPIFIQDLIAEELLPEGASLVPAGRLWKVHVGPVERIDLGYWRYSREPEEVARLFRRKRGQAVTFHRDRIEVAPESYERRFLLFLLGARATLADLHLNGKKWDLAARAYESLLALDDSYGRDAETLHALALAYRGLSREAEAEALLRRALTCSPTPIRAAETLLSLSDLFRDRGNATQADALSQEAIRVPGLKPADREALRSRTAPRPEAGKP